MTTATASGRQPASPWISKPAIDLVIGCGAWSLPLLAVSYALTGDASRVWSNAFYSLALVCNYPHYMATVYRAYGHADRRAHRAQTVYATAALAAVGAWAHWDLRLLPWLFTLYVFWSPWHYTGQNFGLLMMFLRRGGVEVTPADRRLLHAAFVASFVLLLAAFNHGVSNDPLVYSLALPPAVVWPVQAAAGLVFVACGVGTLASLARRSSARAMLAPLTLLTTQALWFVVPTAVTWMLGVGVPQTRYSSGILAVMHSAQYLWITQYFARRDEAHAWSAPRYWAALVGGGVLLFLPAPWLASLAGGVDFTASMLIVTAVVNLHHFVIDGVVWKLRDARVARVLTVGTAPSPSPAASTPGRLPPTPARRLAVAAIVLALAALAGVDQWRYWLSQNASNVDALEAAAALNPNDGRVRLQLLRTLIDRGRGDEARNRINAWLLDRPADVDLLVNAGVLALRSGRGDEAAGYWNRALAIDPSMAHVHLYLAELRDAQSRPADALPHYRAYLELMVERRGAAAAPEDIVAVVLKFGDALERSGHRDEAKGQFALAATLAARTGLKSLEAEARKRLP
jgi:hypothetical protein